MATMTEGKIERLEGVDNGDWKDEKCAMRERQKKRKESFGACDSCESDDRLTFSALTEARKVIESPIQR